MKGGVDVDVDVSVALETKLYPTNFQQGEHFF